MRHPRGLGDERKILEYFQANPDRTISIHELAREISSSAKNLSRRVRALREAGWTILSNNDRPALSPGEYIFPKGQVRGPSRKKRISSRLRAEVLRRDRYQCQSCGQGPPDIDPDTRRSVKLQVHHIDDTLEEPRLNEIWNLRTRCSTCNEGARHFDPPPPDYQKIIGMIRAANHEVREKGGCPNKR